MFQKMDFGIFEKIDQNRYFGTDFGLQQIKLLLGPRCLFAV